jgi:tRNA (guanine37-N1)-methyltransferase
VIAHLNLREEVLPYKHIIANVLKDKSPYITTVINKAETIGDESEFRTFKYEVLEGEDDLNVSVKHENCIFEFDYSKVYWNTRLQTEHRRLISQFKEGEAICDVMAGVGPFSVPAGKNHVFSYANDLNPEGYKYLNQAIHKNKVQDWVRPFNEDGHTFIRTAARELLHADHSEAFPVYASAKDAAKHRRPLKYLKLPLTFSHYVMNLPRTALEFLPSFIGLYSEPIEQDKFSRKNLDPNPEKLFKPYTTVDLPMIHVYCFNTKSDDDVAETKAICKEISKYLEYEITPDTPELTVTNVRTVAPNKNMFCASFRLPEEVAFRKKGAS